MRKYGPKLRISIHYHHICSIDTVSSQVQTEAAANDGPSGTSQTSGPGGMPPRTQPNRPHTPGSWLPVAPSLEQQLSHNDQDAEIDRQYLENLEAIHSFGDESDVGRVPTMFEKASPSEPPVKNELIEKFFSSGNPDAMIKEYNTMFDSFPFVPIPSQTSAHNLNAAKPMLFLAILTATSWNDHPLQRKLDQLYREELAKRTIISPRRTLSLLQSLLVYLAWSVASHPWFRPCSWKQVSLRFQP